MTTLVLGGTRSGKSAVAERLAQTAEAGSGGGSSGGAVAYLATTAVDDVETADRVAAHRARRPASWTTVECGGGTGLLDALDALDAEVTVLIDSLTAWVAAADRFAVDVEGLCRRLTTRTASTVVVSDEVGMGVHPSSSAGRAFRDALGTVNQAVAAVADEVLLVVAGRQLRLERG